MQNDTDEVADASVQDTISTSEADAAEDTEAFDAALDSAESEDTFVPEDTSSSEDTSVLEDSFVPEDSTPIEDTNRVEDTTVSEDMDGVDVPEDSAPVEDTSIAEDTTADTAVMDVAPDAPDTPQLDGLRLGAGLPLVHSMTDASAERLTVLVREALDGLGFAGSIEGPQENDRVVVGYRYLAWIDETGFYGKMNGLWWLNGQRGDGLDFVGRDTLGRPVNLFIPGEDGLGRWGEGYTGAEHLEFPSQTPEANDNPSCAEGDWCNQYSLDEASHITDPDIPWWSACNANDANWDARHLPIVIEALENGGLRLVYEGRLVKEADGDGNWDGDACHQDWLFPDLVRRPVFLQLGYELHPDQPWFDRTMQFRNPVGNPPFQGPLSLIGGFVITDWPNPHYMKSLHRFVRPVARGLDDPYHDIRLEAGRWNGWPSEPVGRDIVFGWMRQPFLLSGLDDFVEGWTVRMDHLGESDNDDSGFCMCEVHGGLEIGGGLLHGGISLPIAPGQSSVLARRRLQFGGEGWRPVSRRVFQAETQLNHGPGRAEVDGWAAATADHSPGHIVYGPYSTDWGDGPVQIVFDLLIDNNSSNNEEVANIDVYDATAGEQLASRRLRRGDFAEPQRYESFVLETNLAGRAGHQMEVRVYWQARAYMRVDKVTVFGAD